MYTCKILIHAIYLCIHVYLIRYTSILNYVHMQDIYEYMQDNFVYTQYDYVYIKDNFELYIHNHILFFFIRVDIISCD